VLLLVWNDDVEEEVKRLPGEWEATLEEGFV
jgi:hypothetical protein